MTFLDLKNNVCPLCHSELMIFLRNQTIYNFQRKIPKINARLTGRKFVFKLSYTSQTVSLNGNCTIDVDSNEFMFESVEEFSEENLLSINLMAFGIFEEMYPGIEMHCVNKLCKHNYYITTSYLKRDMSFRQSVKILPLFIDMECFNLSSFWVQNDWINCKTNIYNTKSAAAQTGFRGTPISTPLIRFESLDKDSLFNRLKTIVNFS